MNVLLMRQEREKLVTRMREAHEGDQVDKFDELRTEVAKIDKKIDQQSFLDEQSVRAVKRDSADVAQQKRIKTDYSLGKALRHASKGGWDGFENEVQQELRSKAGSDKHPENAVLIPDELFEERAVNAGTTGVNVATESFRANEFLPVLRDRTIAGALGARTISGTGDKVRIPKQGAETTASWQTETGAVSNTDMTFVAPIEFEAKRLSYMTSHSDQIVREQAGGLSIQRIIMDEGAKAMAQAVDTAIFATGGTQIANAPTQLWKNGTVGSITRSTRSGDTNGAALADGTAYDEILSLAGASADANLPMSRPGFAINHKTMRKLKTVRRLASTTDSNGTIIPAGSTQIDGYPTQVSEMVTDSFSRGTGSTSVMFYSSDWQYLVICNWGPMASVLIDQYSLAHQSTVRLIWHSFLDFKILRDQAFAWYDSILTT